MKKRAAQIFLLIAIAALALAISGCGDFKPAPAEDVLAQNSGSGLPPGGTLTPANDPNMPSDTPAAAVRQSFRNVGPAGCTAYRTFSGANIVPGGDLEITLVITGCTSALQSFVFSDNVPAGLTVSTIRVEIKRPAFATTTPAYTYEAPTAPSNYHHWFLGGVPVAGAAEFPAGATLAIYYRITDPGTNPAGFAYNFSLYLWAGHEPPAASNNDDWGYADSAVTITVGIPPLGASGGVTNESPGYTPSRAFDGNYTTWWAGKQYMGGWNLYYGFPAVQHMDYIFINYLAAANTPTTTTIYYSSDGISWTNAGDMPPGTKPSLNINANMKYIRIKMRGDPPGGPPIIRDIDWLPVTNSTASTAGLDFGPGSNPDFYFPSNAFDNNLATWWVGLAGPGPWDLYYNFSSPTIINQATVYYYSVNHKPTTSTIEYGNDGATWTSAGTLPALATAVFNIDRKTSYFHLNMAGTPPVGYPLVKDIQFGSPLGPSGGLNFGAYTPSRAFDGNMGTQWAGHANDGEWYLFYGYAAPRHFGLTTVYYANAASTPTNTKVYLSTNGHTWIYIGTMSAGVTETLNMNYTMSYICIEMTGTPPITYPVVNEITY